MAPRLSTSKSEELVRTVARPKLELRNSFIKYPFHQEPQKLQIASRSAFSVTFGSLGNLPVEVLDEIIDYLDLSTLAVFRSLCSTAKNAVDHYPPYRDVVKYAPKQLQIIQNTGLGQYFVIREVHKALITEKCKTCGDFGGFVYLLDMTRCCFWCLETSNQYSTIDKNTAQKQYGVLDDKILSGLRCLQPRPGYYGPLQVLCKDTIDLVRRIDVLTATKMRYGNLCATLMHETVKFTGSIEQFHDRHRCVVPMGFLDRKADNLEEGVCCRGCEADFEELVAGAPNLDDSNYIRAYERGWKAANRKFTVKGFHTHFMQCKAAQDMWEDQ